jgi:hypothetical protein
LQLLLGEAFLLFLLFPLLFKERAANIVANTGWIYLPFGIFFVEEASHEAVGILQERLDVPQNKNSAVTAILLLRDLLRGHGQRPRVFPLNTFPRLHFGQQVVFQ